MTSGGGPAAPRGPDGWQDRPTPAGAPRRLSIEARLSISVAICVAAVIGVLTFSAVRIAVAQADGDLRETARVTAIAVADEIELRQEQATEAMLLPVLRDFTDAARDVYSISVYRGTDPPVPVITTSTVAPMPADLVQRVARTGEPEWNDTIPHLALIAVPVAQGGEPRPDLAPVSPGGNAAGAGTAAGDVVGDVTGVVVVAVSLSGVERLQRTAGLASAGGAVLAVVMLTWLIHLLGERLVLSPLHEIRRVMSRATSGDLSARAAVAGDGEMRELADGLNAMLTELHDLHRSLNDRVESTASQLRDRSQQLVRSYESVLELRDAAGRAQQLAAVGQTMAEVAHQIGTPLGLVSGHVQLLQRSSTDPAVQRRLQIVQEQVDRVTTSVRDLLERARPAGERRPTDLAATLHRLSDAMRGRLAATDVTLDLQAAGALLVEADETQLELALLNLMTNALDAMPGGGTLTLHASRHGATITLDVGDTGSGIAADLLPRIFDPWVTSKSSGRGSGLGLSITRDVIAGHRGTIVVESTGPGGTRFTIELPAAEAAEHS